MIIDAMDILYSGNVDGYCIVSSDSDFTRLAARLRESGMLVLGMGEEKTPKPFISACNQFKYLDLLYRNQQEEEKKEDLLLQQKLKNPETAANRAALAPGRTKTSSGYAKPLMLSSRNFPTKRDGFPPDSWATSLGNDFRILMCVITDIPS